jgi:hypothetical protein
MKTKHILTALHFCVGLFFFALPQQSEAQFLNKLTKGLEKVNKGLDKFNKGMDKLNEAARERSGKESTPKQNCPRRLHLQQLTTPNWRKRSPIPTIWNWQSFLGEIPFI